MDRKEAADLLDNLIGMVEDSGGRDYDTALRMGIEALSAQPDHSGDVNGKVDLIDRQAAIDALMPIYKSASLRNRNVFGTAIKCMATIEELPSAQPKEVFEIGKPYPLKGFEFKIWKDAYGNDWVEIRKYQEPWEWKQDG